MSNSTATPDYGNNPQVQKKLAIAARAIRKAIAEIDKACQAAEDNGDDEKRCDAAALELEGALYHVEWKPPKEVRSAGRKQREARP
jgi:hypothetical protein